jgi:5-methylcytosine-specific restriction endonuclease McrA
MATLMRQRILVLNRLWQAVNIVGVKRGFSLLVQDHARVINAADGSFLVMDAEQWIAHSLENPPPDDKNCIHTVRYRLRIPQVLLLRQFDRLPTKEVKFNRQNIFERDGYVCQYCNRRFPVGDLNLDHVIPRDRGGKTTWENVVTSCIRCNTRKANRMPHQAGMHLSVRPARPKWRPFVCSVVSEGLEGEHEEVWQHFLGGLS